MAKKDVRKFYRLEARCCLEEEPSRKIKALRMSVISQIAFNNTTEINKTIERLDKSASRFTIVSVLLIVIEITIAFLQIFHK